MRGKILGEAIAGPTMNDANPIPKILLYGNSIFIESLTSKLKLIEGWDVRRNTGGEVGEPGEINFIVADLCDAATSRSLPMLCALPGAMLIGVDSIANTLTVRTGRSHPLDAMQDVLDVLKKAM